MSRHEVDDQGRPDDRGRRLYELFLRDAPGCWYLGEPEPSVDSWPFRRGEPIEALAHLRIAVREPGVALDMTLDAGLIVVADWVAEMIDQITPADVQRIPVAIEGTEGSYELLHVLTRIDCIDPERTRAKARGPGGMTFGTLAELSHLIGDDGLYAHIEDIALNSAGIDGPRIFRVPRWDLWPVVTEEIKLALEEHNVTGVMFTELRTTP